MNLFDTISFTDILASLGMAFLFGKVIFSYNKNSDEDLLPSDEFIKDSLNFSEAIGTYAEKYNEPIKSNDCPYCHCAHQNGAKCENCGAPLGV